MSELKPCPFCGGEARLVNCGSPMVVCLHGCCQIVDDKNSVEHWNTRPIEDELRAELARRDEIIARLKEDGERLVSHALWVGKFLGIKDCIFCGMRAKGKAEIEHTSLCPITLHRALMKELE